VLSTVHPDPSPTPFVFGRNWSRCSPSFAFPTVSILSPLAKVTGWFFFFRRDVFAMARLPFLFFAFGFRA